MHFKRLFGWIGIAALIYVLYEWNESTRTWDYYLECAAPHLISEKRLGEQSPAPLYIKKALSTANRDKKVISELEMRKMALSLLDLWYEPISKLDEEESIKQEKFSALLQEKIRRCAGP